MIILNINQEEMAESKEKADD